MSSVYMPRLKDATKLYKRRIYRFDRISLLNVINAMLVANVVPDGKWN